MVERVIKKELTHKFVILCILIFIHLILLMSVKFTAWPERNSMSPPRYSSNAFCLKNCESQPRVLARRKLAFPLRPMSWKKCKACTQSFN